MILRRKTINLRFERDQDGVRRATYIRGSVHWHFAIHVDGPKEIRWHMTSHCGFDGAHGIAEDKHEARRRMTELFKAFTSR